FLQVSATPTSTQVGNYSLAVDFGQIVANLKTFAQGSVSSTQPAGDKLYIAQNQLFQFVLSAGTVNAPADARVHMTITDQNGNIGFDLVARAGETVSGSPVFLVPGAYTVRFTAESPSGAPLAGLSYVLQGASLTDPIGPVVGDPTLNQQYTNGDGTYTYP